MSCLHYQVLHAKQPWRKLVSGFSFACNKHPPQFTDDKSNDSSIREGIPLDALNWFGRGYELHTPKSVGREGSKAWALSVVPHFSLSPPRVAFSRVGWFSRALAFRSLYYPRGKMGTTRSLQVSLLTNSSRKVPYTYQNCLDTFLNVPHASFRDRNQLYERFVELTM